MFTRIQRAGLLACALIISPHVASAGRSANDEVAPSFEKLARAVQARFPYTSDGASAVDTFTDALMATSLRSFTRQAIASSLDPRRPERYVSMGDPLRLDAQAVDVMVRHLLAPPLRLVFEFAANPEAGVLVAAIVKPARQARHSAEDTVTLLTRDATMVLRLHATNPAAFDRALQKLLSNPAGYLRAFQRYEMSTVWRAQSAVGSPSTVGLNPRSVIQSLVMLDTRTLAPFDAPIRNLSDDERVQRAMDNALEARLHDLMLTMAQCSNVDGLTTSRQRGASKID